MNDGAWINSQHHGLGWLQLSRKIIVLFKNFKFFYLILFFYILKLFYMLILKINFIILLTNIYIYDSLFKEWKTLLQPKKKRKGKKKPFY